MWKTFPGKVVELGILFSFAKKKFPYAELIYKEDVKKTCAFVDELIESYSSTSFKWTHFHHGSMKSNLNLCKEVFDVQFIRWTKRNDQELYYIKDFQLLFWLQYSRDDGFPMWSFISKCFLHFTDLWKCLYCQILANLSICCFIRVWLFVHSFYGQLVTNMKKVMLRILSKLGMNYR